MNLTVDINMKLLLKYIKSITIILSSNEIVFNTNEEFKYGWDEYIRFI